VKERVGLSATGLIGQPPATNVQIDHLQSILQALSQRGLSYSRIAISTNVDAEVPGALGVDVRLIDYDAVLVRTQPVIPRRSAQQSPLKVTGIQIQRFMTNLSITSPLLGSLTVPRGWISVDATTSGKPFRFGTTHLESFSSPVRLAPAHDETADESHRNLLHARLHGDTARRFVQSKSRHHT
jgi:hypothetical protein